MEESKEFLKQAYVLGADEMIVSRQWCYDLENTCNDQRTLAMKYKLELDNAVNIIREKDGAIEFLLMKLMEYAKPGQQPQPAPANVAAAAPPISKAANFIGNTTPIQTRNAPEPAVPHIKMEGAYKNTYEVLLEKIKQLQQQ